MKHVLYRSLPVGTMSFPRGGNISDREVYYYASNAAPMDEYNEISQKRRRISEVQPQRRVRPANFELQNVWSSDWDPYKVTGPSRPTEKGILGGGPSFQLMERSFQGGLPARQGRDEWIQGGPAPWPREERLQGQGHPLHVREENIQVGGSAFKSREGGILGGGPALQVRKENVQVGPSALNGGLLGGGHVFQVRDEWIHGREPLQACEDWTLGGPAPKMRDQWLQVGSALQSREGILGGGPQVQGREEWTQNRGPAMHFREERIHRQGSAMQVPEDRNLGQGLGKEGILGEGPALQVREDWIQGPGPAMHMRQPWMLGGPPVQMREEWVPGPVMHFPAKGILGSGPGAGPLFSEVMLPLPVHNSGRHGEKQLYNPMIFPDPRTQGLLGRVPAPLFSFGSPNMEYGMSL